MSSKRTNPKSPVASNTPNAATKQSSADEEVVDLCQESSSGNRPHHLSQLKFDSNNEEMINKNGTHQKNSCEQQEGSEEVMGHNRSAADYDDDHPDDSDDSLQLKRLDSDVSLPKGKPSLSL